MNVLKWLNDYITNEVALSAKAKGRLNPDSYFRVLAKKENRFIRDTNFAVVLQYANFPEELLVFGKAQIMEIGKFVESIETYQEFCVHLQLLAKILDDFEKADDLKNPVAVSIFRTYETLKLCLKNRFPEIYKEYRKRMASFEEKSASRPNCVECGSSHIVSNGVKTWLCKDCGRQFRKVKRK